MLTIFSCPKPFRGHIDIIQRNAITSWTLLNPKPEILLMCDEEGTAEVCQDYGLRHILEVERNKHGKPLINSIFAKAEKAAKYPLMCYVNCDIILMDDFIDVIKRLKDMRNFLLIGQRTDVPISKAVDFSRPNWEKKLQFFAAEKGLPHPPTGIDYFVFPQGLFGNIPPFAIGRMVWDAWLVYRAHTSGAKIINATSAVTAIHQNHDYAHQHDGLKGIFQTEVRANLKLAGGWHRLFTINDASYSLTPDSLRTIPIRKHLKERLKYFFIVPLRKTLKMILRGAWV